MKLLYITTLILVIFCVIGYFIAPYITFYELTPKQQPTLQQPTFSTGYTNSFDTDIIQSSFIFEGRDGNTYMTITRDGVLTFGENVTPKEAAKELAYWFNKFVKEEL